MRQVHNTAWAATALAGVVALAMPATASAEPGGNPDVVDEVMLVDARIYYDGSLTVLTGPNLDEGCIGKGFDPAPFKVVTNPAGVERATATYRDTVYVYDITGFADPFEWLGSVCPGIDQGFPAPEPVASGIGLLTYSGLFDAELGELTEGRTGVNATLTTPDGSRVHLRASGLNGTFEYDVVRLRP